MCQLFDLRHLTEKPLFALDYALTMAGGQHTRKSMKASFDSYCQHVISSDERTNDIIVFDVQKGELVSKIAAHSKPVRVAAAAVVNNRQMFVSGAEDARARFWVEKRDNVKQK